VRKLVKVAFRLPFISPSDERQPRCTSGIVVRRYECAKLADRWPAAVGGPDYLSRLFMRD
jgi:hypothetical protein